MRIAFHAETNELLTPISVVEALVQCASGTKYTKMFDTEDLEQISEHLLVYCRHNKEMEE